MDYIRIFEALKDKNIKKGDVIKDMEKTTASYNAQLNNRESKYYIQFETNNYILFKKVERSCQSAIDNAHQPIVNKHYQPQVDKKLLDNTALAEKEYKANFYE